SFIERYSAKAYPMTQLLRKDQAYVWRTDQQKAFDAIKASMTSAPILAYPDFSRRFSLYTDASKKGLGAILGQKGPDNKREHVILYISRSLTQPETHYGSSELECLGVVWAVTKLQQYLWHQQFDIYTDHQALTTLLNMKHTNSKFIRWVIQLQEFDFKIHYRPGPQNRADSLLRSYFALLGLMANDTEIHGKPYRRDKDQLRRIPAPEEIPIIMSECHVSMTSGHVGINATKKRIKRLFWWKNMDADIKRYVQACDTCQRYDPPVQSQPMHPIPVEGPFDRWGIDLKGPLTAF